MSLVSLLPPTEVIMYFKRVDNSGEAFLFNFFKPSNSALIFFSSEPVSNLKVISVPVEGRVKLNSFTPF
jgi:hypothetical protein